MGRLSVMFVVALIQIIINTRFVLCLHLLVNAGAIQSMNMMA